MNKESNKANIRISKQILIVDILLYIAIAALYLFVQRSVFLINSPFSTNVSMALYLSTFFIFFLIPFSFFIYVEYKFNKLKFKNIFVYLGLLISFNCILSALIIPSNYSLPFNQVVNINTNLRLYSVIFGLLTGLSIIIYFYLLPRKILSKKTLEIFLLFLLCIPYLVILIGLFVDKDNYIWTLQHHFTDSSHPVVSIITNKNSYGQMLFVGFSLSLMLYLLNKKKRYLFLSIPFLIVLPFTFSKISIVITYVSAIAFIIMLLVFNFKKTKQNLKVLILISSFVIFCCCIGIVFLFNSQSGIMFNIKTYLKNFIENASATFNSRREIWRCAFLLLKPAQLIFGCGGPIYNICLNLTYRADPQCPEDPAPIYFSHNATVELLGEGGIILLLANIFLYGYLIYIISKIFKKNKQISIFVIINLILLICFDLVTDISLILPDPYRIFVNFFTIIPVMSIYYMQEDKSEIEIRKEIINDSKHIRKDINDSLLIKLNKKRKIISAKFITIMYKK